VSANILFSHGFARIDSDKPGQPFGTRKNLFYMNLEESKIIKGERFEREEYSSY
jgi:hypothetical protein